MFSRCKLRLFNYMLAVRLVLYNLHCFVTHKFIAINRNSAQNLGSLSTVKLWDQKLPCREEADSRENHNRRKMQMSRHSHLETPRRLCEAPGLPSRLETEPVILENVRQQHVGKVFQLLACIHFINLIKFNRVCLCSCGCGCVCKGEWETKEYILSDELPYLL